MKKLGRDCLSSENWMSMTKEIKKLHELQILQSPEQQQKSMNNHPSRFDSAPVHIRMLNDVQRTTRYQQAIRETVKPDDIVLDIGTGSGILAMTAAKAGAKHVYAIERSAMGKLAKDTFARNGLADKITLLEGDSREVVLPEKATVLVSEIIGNDPLQENMLSITKDAANRHLTADARLIPSHLYLYALPVTIPEKTPSSYYFNSKMIKDWKDRYDIDFSRLQEADSARQPTMIVRNTYKLRDWPSLGDPVLLSGIDMSNITSSMVQSKNSLVINKEGLFNGLLLCFSAQLTNKIELSVHPDKVEATNHWANVIWMPNQSWDVKPGDSFNIDYQFKNGSQFVVRSDNQKL